jgi:hypothetical protein
MSCSTFSLGPLRRPRVSAGLVIAATLVAASSPLIADPDPQAEKLFAESRARMEHAHSLRAAASEKAQAAADDEAAASEAEREAKVLQVRALSILKADANRMKAFTLRNESQTLFTHAHRLAGEARNAELQADRDRHNAAELAKAVAQVKDQPAVAAALENDIRALAADEKVHQAEHAAKRQQAAAANQRAIEFWEQADGLDPEGARRVGPKPTPHPIKEVIKRDPNK